MNIKSIFTDEDAVSPVIGVILMVAITVILAAVIGAFVLGIGGSQEQVPQASFSYDYADNDGTTADELTIRHDGGDEMDGANVYVTVTDSTGTADVDDAQWGGTINAGTTYTATAADNGDDLASATVVWKSPSSDDTNVISEWDA